MKDKYNDYPHYYDNVLMKKKLPKSFRRSLKKRMYVVSFNGKYLLVPVFWLSFVLHLSDRT